MFKLGWANYQQKKYDEAIAAFKQQTEKFPSGDLAVEGAFMVAESQFQKGEYEDALQGFLKAFALVNASEKTSDSIKLMTRLHGAKSANEVKQYEATAKFLDKLETVFAKSDYLADAWLELGRAYRAQDEPDKAIEAFETAAIESLGATGAQARCLVGEVLFAQKKHDEAIKNYKRVMYGYGGEKATAEAKKWQALSGYEAARCTMVQINSEKDAAKKQALIEETKKLFNYVIEKHPDDKLAQQSKAELEKLSKLP
jgi:tetratricopeptide (TPR) repeat protein